MSEPTPPYHYPEHHAADVWSAISLAEALRANGAYDLFRGQRHTFPIMPSAFRPGVDHDDVVSILDDFATWVHNTPDLSSLHENLDAITAVAQHYGLKTPFLDFSYSPRVAGYFATDGGKAGDTGTIICINRERFRRSWETMNGQHHASNGFPLTDIVEIDVKNLWRLQAQEGAFVRCHVTPTVLEMFSYMLHIYFPQNPGTVVEATDRIYPAERSHLEVLLDQYFLVQSYPDRQRRLRELWDDIIQLPSQALEDAVLSFFKSNKLPDNHPSWETAFARSWLEEPDEEYGPTRRHRTAQLVLPTQDYSGNVEREVERIVSGVIATTQTGDRPNMNWNITFPDGRPVYVNGEGVTPLQDEWTEYSMSEALNTIYSGMRYLPYTDQQIVRAITRYIVMTGFGIHKVMGDACGVEFEGAGVRGRGFCSPSRVRNALRDDFYQLVKPDKLNEDGELGFGDLLFTGRFIRTAYLFEKFVELFVEDLIPTQAVLAVEGLVIGLNPMRLEVMGES